MKKAELVAEIKKSVESNHNVILTGAAEAENTRLAQETAAALLGCVDADGNPDLKALETVAKGPNRQYLYYQVEPGTKFEDFSAWLEEVAKGLQNRGAKTAAAMEEPLIVAVIEPENCPEKVVFVDGIETKLPTLTAGKEYDILKCVKELEKTYYLVKSDTDEDCHVSVEHVAALVGEEQLPTTELRPVTVKPADPGEFVVVIDGLDQVDWMMAPLPPPTLSEKVCFPGNAYVIATMTDTDLEHSGAVAFWYKHLTWHIVQVA